MKKTSFFILLATFYLLLSSAPLAFAQPAPPDLQLRPKCDPTLAPTLPGSCDLAAFVGFIQNIIEFMFYISIPIAVMFIVWGSFVIMTAGGSETRFQKGKTVITAAIVGIIIVFSSNLIVTTIEKALKSGAEQILK